MSKECIHFFGGHPVYIKAITGVTVLNARWCRINAHKFIFIASNCRNVTFCTPAHFFLSQLHSILNSEVVRQSLA